MLSNSELKCKSVTELRTELKNLKQEQFNLRFQKASDQLTSTARVRQVKRQIARVNTFINEQLTKGVN